MARQNNPTDQEGIDPLTGLPRLGAGGTSLATVLATAKSTRRKVAVLHLDLDYFHMVNDNMGAGTGDQALAVLAQRLRQALPSRGWVWRVGSDEFIIAVAYRQGEADGQATAEILREVIEAPVSVPPYSMAITASMGIAVYPDHALDPASLLDYAERALRQSKRRGLRMVGLFSERASEQATSTSALAADLAKAIENDELCLHYQPQVSAQDGSLVGFEGLLRWKTKGHGILRPHHFLPVADKAGVAAHIGTWVIERAVRQLAQWRSEGLDYLSVAVHVADALLQRPGLADSVRALLHKLQVPAAALELEIADNLLTPDAHRVLENLAELRALGVVLTVNDFGMGGSSLTTLAMRPLDRLKLDRSFITSVASDTRRATIVRGIVAMGHQLGMRTVAKGVESEAQLGFLRRNHCDYFQGYLFGAPLPVEELQDTLRRRFLLPEAFSATHHERTLLLLDDEENVLRALVRLFRREGYRILTASSVREAFDLLATHATQVIVSDQRMGDMSGTEFLTRVRELYPDTIRMVLSGYTDLATITDAINRGAIYRFLTKPWNDDELREHIRAAFRTYERRAAGEADY